MSASSELSIIIPVRNRERLLGRCLESIEAQTYRPLHVIVVDNNSSDRTAEIAEEWAIRTHSDNFRVSIVKEPRPGASNARNRGLKEVDSDCVMWFDSDDAMRPRLAEKAMQAFAKYPDAQAVSWKVLYHPISGGSRVLRRKRHRILYNQIIHSILRTHSYALRTDTARSVALWDSSLPVWNDWELGIRLAAGKLRLHFLPDVLADIYAQRKSLTGTAFSDREGDWEKALEAAERSIEESGLKNTRRWLRLVNYRRVILAARYQAEGNEQSARSLLGEALDNPHINAFRKCLLRFAFVYASRGGRGIASAIGWML